MTTIKETEVLATRLLSICDHHDDFAFVLRTASPSPAHDGSRLDFYLPEQLSMGLMAVASAIILLENVDPVTIDAAIETWLILRGQGPEPINPAPINFDLLERIRDLTKGA